MLKKGTGLAVSEDQFQILSKQIEGVALFLQQFATATEKRFDAIETRIGHLESDVAVLKKDVGVLKNHVGALEEEAGSIRVRITTIETEMVTKEYLDYKLMDFISRGKKEDHKMNTLVHLLCDKQLITKQEMRRIVALEPYTE